MKRLACRVALVSFLLGSLVPMHAAAGSDSALFNTPPAKDGGAVVAVAHDAVRRQREVKPRLDLLVGPDGFSALRVGDRVDLNLFVDVDVSMTVTEVTTLVGGGYAWSGTLDGVPLGSAVLVLHEGALAGRVVMPGAVYRIGRTPDGSQVVEQIDTASLPSEAPPLVRALTGDDAMRLGGENLDTAADAASQIDVMVLYTASARAAAGGTAAIRAEAALAVVTTNQAYANNNLVQRLRLVFSGEIPLAEKDFAPDLVDLLASVWADPLVARLRDLTRADLVSVLVHYGPGLTFCGYAYLLNVNSTSFARHAFSAVDRTCATANLSFAHELGHNMGAHHDTYVIGAGPTLFPYSHGYVDLVAHHRTIMAYTDQCVAAGVPCPKVPYFSTPDIMVAGRTIGDAASADNARTLRETAETVANFRPALTSPLTLSAGVNQTAFVTGNTLLLSVSLANPGTTGTVDLYLALVLPDGTALFVTAIPLTGPSNVVIGNLVDVSTYRPIATGIPLETPFAGTIPNFIAYPWSGVEPPGGWVWVLLATTPGALADDVLATGELVSVALTPFTFGGAIADK